MKKRIWFVIAGIAALSAASWGPIVSNVEQAKYTVVKSYGAVEIRDYAPMIVAETRTTGERKAAITEGFRTIADYIFGNNVAAQSVAMTAPVTQQANQEIAMTAPVMQQDTTSGQWNVRFVMPASYTMESLPKPKNDAVKLKKVGAKRYAVKRFSGMGNNKRLLDETTALEAFIAENHLKPLASPTFAFFNPPWTLPFLRRNEVMIEITKEEKP